MPFTVTVPAVPPKAALLPAAQGVAAEPLNQLAVLLSHVPAPPLPLAPQLKVWALAAVHVVASSSVAAPAVMDRLTCSAAWAGRAPGTLLQKDSLADLTFPPFARSSSDAATQAPNVSFHIVLNDLFIFIFLYDE
nr:hypothetical protein [Burkholderia multivorans]